MLILYVLIGLAALVVGIVAMILKQYLTVMAMGIVIVGQIWNYYKWKKKDKDRNFRRFVQPYSYRAFSFGQLPL